MKNVIYINCFADPWLKVAYKMQSEYSYKPVYWVGYNEDNSEKKVPENFDGIVYHKYFDAWKGVFPKQIADKASEMYIDVDFIRQFASEELQAIKMMDRLDFDQRSFNFMERQRHFRNLVRSWMAVIEMYKPDLVVTPMIPHRVYDYALFLLCKYYTIPFLSFDHTSFRGRYMVVKDIFSIGDLFIEDYNKNLDEPIDKLKIPNEILRGMESLKKDYQLGAPYYMEQEVKGDREGKGIFNLLRKFKKDTQVEGGQSFGNVLKNGVQCYGKQRNTSIEKSRFSLWQYSIFKLRSNKYKRCLQDYYSKLTVKPDYSQKYVIYGLHYQPEATTSPSADIFVDQRMCIDTLLKNLPEDYFVYVKEHPHQLMSHREGHTSRMKEFYSDLVKNPRIRLIDINESMFNLIINAQAVATCLGTIGWETIVYQKPLIIFGISWYENCPNVLRVKNDVSARQIYDYIKKYNFNEKSLMSYLAAVGDNTYYAYYYKASNKSESGLTEKECVQTIVKSIVDNI